MLRVQIYNNLDNTSSCESTFDTYPFELTKKNAAMFQCVYGASIATAARTAKQFTEKEVSILSDALRKLQQICDDDTEEQLYESRFKR